MANENLSTSTCRNYTRAVHHAAESMDINTAVKNETIRFYLDMSAESKGLQIQ